MSLTADGAVPIHCKSYPGNRTDDTTHIETWQRLCHIAGDNAFLYVADCKVCTDKQLAFITQHGGCVVTLMPDTWREARTFNQALRTTKKAKRRIRRQPIPNRPREFETFSCFTAHHVTDKAGYTLYWIYSSEKKKRDRHMREQRLQRVEQALAQEKNTDGVFPILCTDTTLKAKEALLAYKYQPRLEKRFEQLKSVHNAAPTLFKNVERVEAMMFLFFMALIMQAVIEREVRQAMNDDAIDGIPIYPKHRPAHHPTTARIIDRFQDTSLYRVVKDDTVIKQYQDELTSAQRSVLSLLGMSENTYWSNVT